MNRGRYWKKVKQKRERIVSNNWWRGNSSIFIYLFFVWPHYAAMQNPSSLTVDQTHIPPG